MQKLIHFQLKRDQFRRLHLFSTHNSIVRTIFIERKDVLMNFNSSHLIRLGDTILKAMPTFKLSEHQEIANVGTLLTIHYEIQRNKRSKVRWMSRLGLSGKFQVL